jgi:hypothetical protein
MGLSKAFEYTCGTSMTDSLLLANVKPTPTRPSLAGPIKTLARRPHPCTSAYRADLEITGSCLTDSATCLSGRDHTVCRRSCLLCSIPHILGLCSARREEGPARPTDPSASSGSGPWDYVATQTEADPNLRCVAIPSSTLDRIIHPTINPCGETIRLMLDRREH